MNWKKKGSDWIIKIISQTSCWNDIVLRLKTLVGKQNKKVRDWRCYYPDSPISTFKTLPDSNFSFGEVEGFDAHCFFIINGIFFFLLHLYRCYYCHQCTFFFKNSSYIFSKSGRVWDENAQVCYYQGGYLVSIETQEEWQFISHEIQKRGTSNTCAWHIGLRKRDAVWTWFSGRNLSISKWLDS